MDQLCSCSIPAFFLNQRGDSGGDGVRKLKLFERILLSVFCVVLVVKRSLRDLSSGILSNGISHKQGFV